jgi:hypothetical protein
MSKLSVRKDNPKAGEYWSDRFSVFKIISLESHSVNNVCSEYVRGIATLKSGFQNELLIKKSIFQKNYSYKLDDFWTSGAISVEIAWAKKFRKTIWEPMEKERIKRLAYQKNLYESTKHD